jgi:hypothetical protein
MDDGRSKGEPLTISTQILERCEAIEECYEFMLAYAAQGLRTNESSRRVREFLPERIFTLFLQ